MRKENLRDDFLSLGIESDKIIPGMPVYEAVIDEFRWRIEEKICFGRL